MNYHAISKLLGLLLVALSASMAPSLLFALYYADGSQQAFLLSMLVTAMTAGALILYGSRKKQDLYHREAIAVVGLGWFLCALAGALPFHFAGAFPTFADCFFESMSGLTTTGSSIITATDRLPNGIESLEMGLLFWRSFTHWLGGMGIIVLFVALLPFLGAGGRALFKSETPGPIKESLTPRVKETAKILWAIYVAFTLLEAAILMGLGMTLHEALCHSFGTLATGGYSTKNGSIADYGTAIQIVIIVFMIVAATNFSLYYRVLRGERKALWRDSEWRTFITIVAAASVYVALALRTTGLYESTFLAIRDAIFQVLAMMTTTGYGTADFNTWPVSVKALMVGLMFVGGSAGSTGGGMKVIRWMIAMRIATMMIEKVYSPRTIRTARVAGAPLSEDIQKATLTFFLIWFLIFAFGSIAVSIIESDLKLVTIVTSVAATLNNIGPGLDKVGATQNYALFHPLTKYLLSLFMALGRLELFTILVLFSPRFWRVR